MRQNATTRDDGTGRFYLFEGEYNDLFWCRFEDPTIERANKAYRNLDRFDIEIRDPYDPGLDYLLFNTDGIYTVSS